MAGKKKSKKVASNPARGFATTSSTSKNKAEANANDDAETIDTPATEQENTEQSPSKPTEQPGAATSLVDLTPEQLEEQLEESELQQLLEKHREKAQKNALRFISRMKTERRLSRQSAESLRLTNYISEEGLDDVFNHIIVEKTMHLPGDQMNSRLLGSPISEEDLCARLWALKQGLAGLDFPENRIKDALTHVLGLKSLHEKSRATAPKEMLWGADECLDFLALACDAEDLPAYDGQQAVNARKEAPGDDKSEVQVIKASNADSEKAVPAKSLKASNGQHAQIVQPSADDESESHDSDSDIEPKYQLNKYLQFKTRLYRRRPSLTRVEPRKGKKQKGRQSSPSYPPSKNVAKLQQRIRKLERDLLFDKEEAEEAWSRLRIRLEVEAAERREVAQKMKPEDNQTQSTPESNPENIKVSGEEDLSEGVGEFFLSLPQEGNEHNIEKSSTSIRDENGSTITLRDFGKWTGLHPRRLLDETCRARDSKVRVTLSLLSSTSFSNRHAVTVRWSQPQHIPPTIALTGIRFQARSKDVLVEMTDVSCPDKIQSEAYVCTAALFLVFSSSPKEEKVYLRLPAIWRSLWAEFNDIKRVQDDAAAREELRELQELVRTHGTAATASEGVSRATHTSGSDLALENPSAVAPSNSIDSSGVETVRLWEARTASQLYQTMLANRRNLPIWPYKDDLLGEISRHQVLILCGETGCGKSTQVPAFILEHEMNRGNHCKIYCTQPRRISALSLARRVSEELGERRNDLGTSRSLIGYAIRLESRFHSQTRLVYATTGIVMRMLESEHGLNEITHLIVDEVHERTIDSDFLLIILRKLMATRPDLKVVLMSATVDAEHFSRYFGGAPIFNIPGRTFPVETFYLEDAIELTNYGSGIDVSIDPQESNFDEDELEDEARQEIPKGDFAQYSPRTREVLAQFNEYRLDFELIVRLLWFIASSNRFVQYSQAILVFLPGIAEIRRLNDILSSHQTFGQGWVIYPLHSTISTEEQEHAFLVPPYGIRKIVLATNIAETGITIPDITCVVDSGKHREIRFDERRQLSRLLEVFISQANAKQRRGRAGRVQNGLCFHLFTQVRHDRIIAASQTPEMLRLSLQDLALRVKICNLGMIEEVLAESLDPPLPKNVRRAVDSLIEVKALTVAEDLTPLGRQLAKLPLDVYLGKLLLFSSIFNCIDAGLSIAAILSSKSPFLTPINAQTSARSARFAFKKGNSDLLTVYNAYSAWRRTCQSNPTSEFQFCRKNYLSPQTLSGIEDLKNQLASALVDAGFLRLDNVEIASLNQSRSSSRRRVFMTLPTYLNGNSDKEGIVDAVIAWSFYPKLLMRDGKGYRNVANNQSVTLHPSSVNKEANEPPKFLSFYHIMQSSSRFYNAHESSAVQDLAVALLCGDADSKLYSGVLSIDGNRLRFALPNWKSTVVLKAWRSQLRKIVNDGIDSPGTPMDNEQRFWFELWQKMFVSHQRSNRQLGRNYSEGPKKIPPRPTPVIFPPCPDFDSHGASVPTLGRLETLFRVKHIKFLKEQHLRTINLGVRNGCSIEDLVPEEYLPLPSWRDKPGTADENEKQLGPRSNETLSNGAAVPGHEAFYNRMIELSYSTEEVYDSLARRPQPPGRQLVRVAQYRRFWTELQLMGNYWDASQDNLNYNDPEVQKALEAQKKESKSKASEIRRDSPLVRSPPNALKLPQSPSLSPISQSTTTGATDQRQDDSEALSSPSKPSSTAYLTYTGRRYGAGSDMPSKHRDDLMRTFVEPVAWSFGCVVERTASQPCLHAGTTRLIADHAMRVFRGPQDRQRSRAKILEGPLMALQCTHETAFAGADPSDVDYVARELGALLVIAQERDREGRTEATPGEGQWWVERPRWGGGSGEAVGKPLLDDDGNEPANTAGETEMATSLRKEETEKKSRKMKQNMKKQLITRSHKPPSPMWEKRVDYMHVGKSPDEAFDTIYMLSAVNHHLALVRLYVHPRFLALLDRSRTLEASSDRHQAESVSWYGVQLARSRWYDVFNAEDRIELMRALWGVMGWLMRDTRSGERVDRDDDDKETRPDTSEGAMDTSEG